MTREINTLQDIVLNTRNPNLGTDRGDIQLEESLRRYGAGRSILVDKEGRIIAGNHVVSKAGEIGITKVRTVKTRGDEIIVVQREDLDLETDSRARELVYVDNRVSETNYNLDTEILLEDLAGGEIDLSKFYREDELDFLLGGVGDDSEFMHGDEEEADVDDGDTWEKITLEVPTATKFYYKKLINEMPGHQEHERFKKLLTYAETAFAELGGEENEEFEDDE